MKVKTLFIALLFCSGVFAQNNSARLDHISLYVGNLDTSTKFYMAILGLDTIPNPLAPYRVKWFRVNDHLELHMVEGLKEKIVLPIMQHTAFTVPSIDKFAAMLKTKSITYYSGFGKPDIIQTRPDGVRQIIFKDPDDNWVEVNERH